MHKWRKGNCKICGSKECKGDGETRKKNSAWRSNHSLHPQSTTNRLPILQRAGNATSKWAECPCASARMPAACCVRCCKTRQTTSSCWQSSKQTARAPCRREPLTFPTELRPRWRRGRIRFQSRPMPHTSPRSTLDGNHTDRRSGECCARCSALSPLVTYLQG